MRAKCLHVVTFVMLLISNSVISHADDVLRNANVDALSELQGKWELDLTINGRRIRSVKIIKDSRETVQRFDAFNGKLIDEHNSDLTVSVDGDVRIVTFQMLDQENANPLSYAYKIEKDFLYEISGILSEKKYKNNSATPRIFRWKRIER